MAKKVGRLATLEVDDGGGFADLACGRDITCTMETNEIGSTCRDDGAFETFEYGRMSGSIDGSIVYDPTNSVVFQKLVDSAFNQTKLTYRFRWQTNVGDPEYSAAGLVTSIVKNAPNDELSSADISIRLTGTITEGTQ